MNVLDLFSGIGGFSLGLERAGMRTVAFCEVKPFARRVLARRWPGVPCYGDVRTVTADKLRSDRIFVDVICGGFPCQDISSAGKKAGIEGAQSGLWSEYARLIGELRPRFVIVENSAALLGRGLDVVLRDLAALRFNAEWHCVPAAYIGAPHGRDRIWIVAYPDGDGEPIMPEHDEACRLPSHGDAHSERGIRSLGLHLARAWREQESLPWDRVWPHENSPMGVGVDDGFPERLDQLSAIGNAVMPQMSEAIGTAIMRSVAPSPIGSDQP